MCSNLLVRHYYLSCLCLYRLSLCKNKYVSWSTTPIYSVFEAIPKRRFLHRKKSSTSYRRDHLQQQKEVSTLAEGKFLFHFSPASMPTTLIQAPAFSDACAKRGFYTGKISYRTLHLCLHGNALPLSQKRDFHPAQFVAATGSIQKNFENRDSSTAKKRFLHAYFGWLCCSNLFLQPFKPLASGVEISFAKCFFLSAGMWKPLFLHIIINK